MQVGAAYMKGLDPSLLRAFLPAGRDAEGDRERKQAPACWQSDRTGGSLRPDRRDRFHAARFLPLQDPLTRRGSDIGS
jgi:hypothetical protein